MRYRPLPFAGCMLLLLIAFLASLCPLGSAQMEELTPPSLQDHASEHHSRHHSLMGPCLDRGQYCDKLKRFCNDFKYQTLVNKECRATCGRC